MYCCMSFEDVLRPKKKSKSTDKVWTNSTRRGEIRGGHSPLKGRESKIQWLKEETESVRRKEGQICSRKERIHPCSSLCKTTLADVEIWTLVHPGRGPVPSNMSSSQKCSVCVCLCVNVWSLISLTHLVKWWQHFRGITTMLFTQKGTNELILDMCESLLCRHIYGYTHTLLLHCSHFCLSFLASSLCLILLASASFSLTFLFSLFFGQIWSC